MTAYNNISTMNTISQILASLLLIMLTSFPLITHAVVKNGFDLNNVLIPADKILHGGPPRDGIPAIYKPQFISGEKASKHDLKANDRVLGIFRHGISKAYPIAILNWHEIVNDHFDNEAIVITYCPLCGTGVAFSADERGKTRTFGVSGLLYNSDVLLYDRESASLWSQLLAQAISGPMKGEKLQQITLQHTSWKDWRHQHPHTLVLSRKTGYVRNYDRDPYIGYITSHRLYFPVDQVDQRFHPKEQVLGIEINSLAKAYPFSELAQISGTINDRIGGQLLKIVFDAENQSARAFDDDGREITSTTAFWFAWHAFHPKTEVFNANK